MTDDPRTFRHLNADGLWPGFQWEGLECDTDGVLRLLPLPKVDGPLPDVARTSSPPVVSGLAIGPDGTVFYSLPGGRILRVSGCGGHTPELCDAGQPDGEPAAPLGLHWHPHRGALVVADAARGEVRFLDPDRRTTTDVWRGFDRPVAVATDADGAVYVVDVARQRIERYTPPGELDPAFWQAVAASGLVTAPVAVAGDGERLAVLDAAACAIAIVDPRGRVLDVVPTHLSHVTTFALADGAYYVADPERRRVVVLRPNGRGAIVRAGDIAGYDLPAAAIAADRTGGLFIVPGAALGPIRCRRDAGHRSVGWLWSQAIAVDGVAHVWQRLQATIALPAGTHAQCFVHTGHPGVPPPPPVDGVFAAPWRPFAYDLTDVFVTSGGGPTDALWVGLHLATETDATPSVSQLRVEFDREGLVSHLPTIYREGADGDFLVRYLGLFQSLFEDLGRHIEDLPALVDAAAAPADALGWLAGFLDQPLPEAWSETQRRHAVATAYARLARRGTTAGLREAVRLETGVGIQIDEPLQGMAWWCLPSRPTDCPAGASPAWEETGDSRLGVTTRLASSAPQGAVLGTSATLGASDLIGADEYGMPLFDDMAYRFTVRVHAAHVRSAETLERVRAVVDRERPAHTAFDLCVIAPGLRVGHQARLGVDTVLGASASPSRLGEGPLVLGGAPRGRLGETSRVGTGTQL